MNSRSYPLSPAASMISLLDVKGKFIDATSNGQLSFSSSSDPSQTRPGQIVRYLHTRSTRGLLAEIRDPFTGKSGLFKWDFNQDRPVCVGLFG